MHDGFFTYLERLESMAFFSGYPLIYAIVHFWGGNNQTKAGIKRRFIFLLPFSYALLGALYLGLQLKDLYPDYSFENIKLAMQEPYLKIWGILAMLFWIPALSKKPVLSLLHSFVFFFFLIRDLFLNFFQSTDKNVVRNDMKIYTDSLLLNIGTLAAVILIYFLAGKMKVKK